MACFTLGLRGSFEANSLAQELRTRPLAERGALRRNDAYRPYRDRPFRHRGERAITQLFQERPMTVNRVSFARAVWPLQQFVWRGRSR